MSNLQTFREALNNFLPDGTINDTQHWDQLMEYLCDMKLLHPKQVKLLQQSANRRHFPVTTAELQEIISKHKIIKVKQFGNAENKALLLDLVSIQKQIRQAKGILSIWKEKGLDKEQINALNILFANGNHKITNICGVLAEKKKLMESISQKQVQLIKSMDQWVDMQKLTKLYSNYEQYQNINQKSIESLYNQIRVREVHYRAKKSQKNIPNGNIFTILGYNSKNDEPVEVTKIHKKCVDFDEINQALMTFNAHKDLLLSPYFLRYKGHNNNFDPEYFLYFREYIDAKNLHHLVMNSSFQLQESVVLFKFWAGQLFRALRDLNMMCSYLPILPIRLEDFYVSDYGLKIVLKSIKFDRIREANDNIQPELLENLAYLLIDLLKGTVDSVNEKFKNVENSSLITALLKARENYQNYEKKIIPCYINFFNIQTHPLFEANQQVEGLEVINNFTVLYGDE